MILFAILDFFLAAVFLWMIPTPAALSIVLENSTYNSRNTSGFSFDSAAFMTFFDAVRMEDFICEFFNLRFSFCLILLICDLMFANFFAL
jgi:hypothetical protein